jgi:hypothetical protein
MVRSSRSVLAASHSSFVMRVACGRCSSVNGLWSRKPTSGSPQQSTETAELRVAYTVVKEEAAQAWEAEATVREDAKRAQE